jgi:hypothetical protein
MWRRRRMRRRMVQTHVEGKQEDWWMVKTHVKEKKEEEKEDHVVEYRMWIGLVMSHME